MKYYVKKLSICFLLLNRPIMKSQNKISRTNNMGFKLREREKKKKTATVVSLNVISEMYKHVEH